MLSDAKRDVAARRTIELLREVGTLLLAFAPLDYMLQPQAELWSLGGFIVLGSSLFCWSLLRELRRLQ